MPADAKPVPWDAALDDTSHDTPGRPMSGSVTATGKSRDTTATGRSRTLTINPRE